MSYKERILDYLWSVAPGGATNGPIARALGISSQQTVYVTTQELAGRRLIRAAKEGATWVFYTLDAHADGGAVRASTAPTAQAGTLTPMTFEALAGRIPGEHYGTTFARGTLSGVRNCSTMSQPISRLSATRNTTPLSAGSACRRPSSRR